MGRSRCSGCGSARSGRTRFRPRLRVGEFQRLAARMGECFRHSSAHVRFLNGLESKSIFCGELDHEQRARLIVDSFRIEKQHTMRSFILFECRERRLPDALQGCRVLQARGKLRRCGRNRSGSAYALVHSRRCLRDCWRLRRHDGRRFCAVNYRSLSSRSRNRLRDAHCLRRRSNL